MTKKFKPGDWVKIKGNPSAPKMEVLRYVTKYDPLIGAANNHTYVECVYYYDGERIIKTVHQGRLLKLRDAGGIYRP